MSESNENYQRLNVYVPVDLAEKAKIEAIRRKTSVSKVVTECLRRFVGEQASEGGGKPAATDV